MPPISHLRSPQFAVYIERAYFWWKPVAGRSSSRTTTVPSKVIVSPRISITVSIEASVIVIQSIASLVRIRHSMLEVGKSLRKWRDVQRIPSQAWHVQILQSRVPTATKMASEQTRSSARVTSGRFDFMWKFPDYIVDWTSGKGGHARLVYAHIKQLDRGNQSHSLFLQRKILHNERPSTTSTRTDFIKCALMWQGTSKENTGLDK